MVDISNTYLSIILPVYNSAQFLENSFKKLNDYIKNVDHIIELIIVDDGSKDESLKIAKSFANQNHSYPVKVISSGKNFGKGDAVSKGMLSANGKYRIFLDSDLAYEPSQINKILRELENGNDLAIACRVDENSRYTISPSFFNYLYTRHISSRILNFILRHTLIPHCRDSQAGLKGFTAKASKEIFSRRTINGFSFDVEILFLAEKMNFKIKEVGIDYKYFNEPTTVAFANDAWQMIKDILTIKFKHITNKYSINNK